MSGLPREVLKWVQSLDLSWQIKTPKWDLTNGYLLGEIFSWYYPHEIWMHSFYNCNSLEQKNQNWYILKNFIVNKNLDIPGELIEGTIHCKEGAAGLLLERMYEILTNRKVKKVPAQMEPDFTDYAYQVKLPMHARSTASKAVKNNLCITEVKAVKNQIYISQKCQKIVNDHLDHRRIERLQDPKRFDIKPTLGERCPRKSVPAEEKQDTSYDAETAANVDDNKTPLNEERSDLSLPITREHSVHFKEIPVRQMDKSSFYNMPIHGF